jgi:hypothetical protein
MEVALFREGKCGEKLCKHKTIKYGYDVNEFSIFVAFGDCCILCEIAQGMKTF